MSATQASFPPLPSYSWSSCRCRRRSLPRTAAYCLILRGYLWGLVLIELASATGRGLWSSAAHRRFVGIAGLVLLPLACASRPAITRVAPSLLLFMALGAGAQRLVAGTYDAEPPAERARHHGRTAAGLYIDPVHARSEERATKWMVAGIGCILVGAACVAAGAWDAAGNRLGLLFFVAGALMWAAYTVSMRRAGLLPLTAASVVCVASLVFYVPGPCRRPRGATAAGRTWRYLLFQRFTNRCFPRSVTRWLSAAGSGQCHVSRPIAESSDW